MRTTLFIIFVLTLNINVNGQGLICNPPVDTLCGRQLDAETKTYFYSLPDQPAEFPGGNKEFIKYFQKNLLLPKDTCEYYTIQLIMLVKSNGTPTFVKLVKPKGCQNLETELKRLIGEMPVWKPAKCKGQLVDHRFYIPIHINIK